MIDNVRAGQNIAAQRQRMNWTQGELARRLNVTHQAVSKWENGVAFPDINTLFALSRLFGVSMEQLLTGEEMLTEAPQNPAAESAPQNQFSECGDAQNESPASEKTIGEESSRYTWDEILSLAPFASRDTLDRLVSQCESACDRDHLFSLAPFLSGNTIDRLIRSSLDKADWNDIISLAPFASRDTLDRLVSQCETACDRDHLFSLAPFLSQGTIDRLILSGGRTKTPASQTAGAESAKEDDALSAWTEAHEKETHKLAAWSEAQEKELRRQMERAARRAERQAERAAEKAAAQAEKIASRISETISRQTAKPVRLPVSVGFKAIRPFSSFLQPHIVKKTDDDRRTQIVLAHPPVPGLEEYAAQTVSVLYESIDDADPLIDRIEEIRRALLLQDYAALNEFAPVLDEHLGPQWLEEYAELCGADGAL